MSETASIHPSSQPMKKHPLRRPGCVIALIVWFLLLLSPCIFIYIATTGEITIRTGSAPGQQIRIWLLEASRQSGFGVSTGSISSQDEDRLCVQTEVNFLLWRGEAESTHYCECFAQTEAGWQTITAEQGDCQSP